MIRLLSFKVSWAFYTQSGGNLYERECREAAGELAADLRSLRQQEPILAGVTSLALGGDGQPAVDVIERLGAWASGAEPYPHTDPSNEDSAFVVWTALSALGFCLARLAGATVFPKSVYSIDEEHFRYPFVRWAAHFPHEIAEKAPDMLEEISRSETIVVVGDIRSSQDLMTYAKSAGQFKTFMLEFLAKTREMIARHGGIFDKFTGDGFIAYFNEAVGVRLNQWHLRSFVEFTRDMQAFAGPMFESWSRRVRKVPPRPVGLGIGADLGRVAFNEPGNHFVAVGEAIVWATRMASAAKAGEVIVNNLLWARLDEERQLGVTLAKQRRGKTKGGEQFLARSINVPPPAADKTGNVSAASDEGP